MAFWRNARSCGGFLASSLLVSAALAQGIAQEQRPAQAAVEVATLATPSNAPAAMTSPSSAEGQKSQRAKMLAAARAHTMKRAPGQTQVASIRRH